VTRRIDYVASDREEADVSLTSGYSSFDEISRGRVRVVPLRAGAALHAHRLGHPLPGTCSMTLDQFDFSWVATSINAAASRDRRVVCWSYGVADAA
jgi:hypothetical protein